MFRSRPLKRTHLPCTWALSSGLLVVLLVAGNVRGAVEGSPHDLIAQGYDVARDSPHQERCRACHLPSSPALQGFLPDVPPVLALSYDSSSIGCFSCHDGTTIVSADVDASRTAFHAASHGNDISGYEELRNDVLALPHLDGKRMECVTCHDPHDNGHRPFLRVDLPELCLLCHSKLVEYGRATENHSGNHLIAVDPVASPLPEKPIKVSGDYRVALPAPYPLEKGKGSGPWHWDLGGHLVKGGTGAIGCMTCHSVHGDEAAPPRQSLLVVDPQNDRANRFCEGCHAGERGDGSRSDTSPNPGGTTSGRTYHPVDDDTANGEGRIVDVSIPSGWPVGTGAIPPLLCTSCHTAHGATSRTSLLRPPEAGVAFCSSCHSAAPSATHHPLVVEGEGDCAKQVPVVDPVTGVRHSCDLCHRGHNAGRGTNKEKEYLPILRESLLGNDLCLRCHPRDNPTCNKETDYRASHFIGDPTLPETYGSDGATLRSAAWPESGMLSPYGGEKGTVMLCLSCHVFRAGAIMSGDKGKSGYLRARSGNPVEWAEDEGVYLCTGCHKANPGTGSAEKGRTHPLLDAEVTKLGHEPVPPATATVNGHLNCDSCHRPHEAKTAGSYYILEAVRGENTDPTVIHPTIDFTVLCRNCHEKF